MYTDYDKLLKTDGWIAAREAVEHVSLAKLKEWRDETGEQSNEFEETFREIIVLDDDEEVSSDDDSASTPDEREQSMEIVSNRVHARDLKPEGYADYPRIDANGMRRVPRRTIVVGRHPVSPHSGPISGSSRPASYQPFREETLHNPHSRLNDTLVRTTQSEYIPAHYHRRSRPTASQPISRNVQPIMREINGRLYQVSVRRATSLQSNEAVSPSVLTSNANTNSLNLLSNVVTNQG